MKKLLIVLTSLFFVTAAVAQNDSLQAPYKRFPSFPPVKLLLPDSVSYFTKNDLPKKTPVMLMMFNPQCEHCQHETEELTKNIDKFKDILVVMTTSMPFDSMLRFREKFHLAQYKNIIVSQDENYFLFSYITPTNAKCSNVGVTINCFSKAIVAGPTGKFDSIYNLLIN